MYYNFVPFGTVLEVSHTKLFEGINNDELNDILTNGIKISANKDDELYKKGYIGIIKHGAATVVRTGVGGNSITVRTMRDGDTFGAASVFGAFDEGVSSIKAESLCEVIYFSQSDFEKMLCKYSKLAINYIVFLSDRIRFLNRRLDTFCAGTTQNKLYEYLISNSNGKGYVDLKISMSELAARLGVGRTSLYRDIASLEKNKLIKRNGKQFIII